MASNPRAMPSEMVNVKERTKVFVFPLSLCLSVQCLYPSIVKLDDVNPSTVSPLFSCQSSISFPSTVMQSELCILSLPPAVCASSATCVFIRLRLEPHSFKFFNPLHFPHSSH